MFEIGPYFALGSIGLGLAVFGYAIIKITSLSYKAGGWEKDFYRVRDDNKALIYDAQQTEAEKARMRDEISNYRNKIRDAIVSGDWNSVLQDAPSLDDLHLGPGRVEEPTHNSDEKGVLPLLEGHNQDQK